MKKYLIVLLALLSSMAYAAQSEPSCSESQSADEVTEQRDVNTNVPAYLKGATITVRLADGKETTVPAERFKVVPRKQQFVVTRTEHKSAKSCTVVENSPNKNRVSAVGGYGATGGLTTPVASAPGVVDVESKVGFVGGLQYQRTLPLLNDRLSVGVQGQSNKTGSLLLGIDF